MQGKDEWDYMPAQRISPLAEAGMGAIRLALLFGSGAIALALIVTPLVERNSRSAVARADLPEGLDMAATGSIRHSGAERYTVRRSVLQPYVDSVCIIRQDGSTSGDC